MKLTPKPLPKAKRPSPESTSTKQGVRASSRFTKTQTVLLSGVPYTGIDQHGQVVPTAHQTEVERLANMRVSIGIFCPPELDNSESRELQILGQAMSQMAWLKVATECEPFLLGYKQGEGVPDELRGRTWAQFDGVILYRQTGDEPEHTKIVRIEDGAQLKAWSTGVITELYRRGILV